MANPPSRAAVRGPPQVDPAIVDNVVFGNVAQTSADAAYLARHAALQAGVPIPSPALTLNRLCGSGFQAVISGAQVRACIALAGVFAVVAPPVNPRRVRAGASR